jgi:putative peptidoglycan lipid II flippase
VPSRSRSRLSSIPVTLLALFCVTLLSKLLGFLSQILVTGLVGTTGQADTYYFAFSIATILSALVLAPAGFVLIPCYIEKKEREGTARANEFANAVLTYLTLLLVLLTLLMALLAGPLVDALGRFPAGLRPLATRVFAATAPLALLAGVGQLLMALSQARKRFVAPAFMGVLHSVVFMSVLVLAWKRLGVYSLILAVTVSLLLQAVVMLSRLAGDGNVYPSLRLRRNEIRQMLLLTWPLLLSQILSTIQLIVSRNIASGLLVGSVAALAYAESLKAVFLDLCVVPVAQVSLPIFSEKIARNEDNSAWEQLQGALSALWFLVTPVVALLWVLSGPLVKLFYQRGAFNAQSTALTASALAFLSWGLLGEAPYYLVARYYLAKRDTWTLTWLAIPFTALYVILLRGLSSVWGLKGIALGHSLTMTTAMVATVLVLRRKVDRPFVPAFGRGVAKIAVSGLGMLFTMQYAVSQLASKLQGDFSSRLALVFLVAGLGLGFYITLLVLLGIARDVPLLLKLRPASLLAQLTGKPLAG